MSIRQKPEVENLHDYQSSPYIVWWGTKSQILHTVYFDSKLFLNNEKRYLFLMRAYFSLCICCGFILKIRNNEQHGEWNRNYTLFFGIAEQNNSNLTEGGHEHILPIQRQPKQTNKRKKKEKERKKFEYPLCLKKKKEKASDCWRFWTTTCTTEPVPKESTDWVLN